MGWIGPAVTVAGVACILLPVIAGMSSVIGGPELPVAITYAPTFVIGGLLLFVSGTAMRAYTDW